MSKKKGVKGNRGKENREVDDNGDTKNETKSLKSEEHVRKTVLKTLPIIKRGVEGV